MPDYRLGALVRPADPNEDKYRLARTMPPRAVDISQPRLLSRWNGKDVRIPIQDQGAMGSCAAWAAIKAALMAADIAGRTNVVKLAAGPLYEQARRLRDWFPDDTGSYIADNLDLLLEGGPAVVEPYRDHAAHDYAEAAWDGKEARDYIASHRPFYPAEDGPLGFLDSIWSALDAGMPVVLGSFWPSAWFAPSQGVVDGDAPYNPNEGAHAYEAWGVVPGYVLCANQWGTGWSADAGALDWDMRPGDFAIPWRAIERGIVFEGRAVAVEKIPEPEPAPTWRERAIALGREAVTDFGRRKLWSHRKGAQTVVDLQEARL
jgi:hypothetical protein